MLNFRSFSATAIACFCVLFGAFAQEKKILDHTAYNDWKSLKSQTISPDGLYVSYEINPYKGDGILLIQNTRTLVSDTIERGSSPEFSADGSYIVFKIKPHHDSIRQLELDEVPKKKWPKDTLVIYRLSDQKTTTVDDFKSYQLGNETAWMAYEVDSNHVDQPEVEQPTKKWFQFWKKQPEPVEVPEWTSEGHVVHLFNPISEAQSTFSCIKDFGFSPNDSILILVDHLQMDTVTRQQVFSYRLSTKDTLLIDSLATSISKFSVSNNDQFLAYLSTQDTSKTKNYRLKLFDVKDNKAYATIDSNFNAVGAGRAVSPNQRLIFTDNDAYLYFGVDQAAEEEPKDSLVKSEKAVLDVWHYQDKRLQPQQLLEKKRDERNSELYILSMKTFIPVQLEDEKLRVRPQEFLKGNYLLARDITPYQDTYNWAVPRLTDVYRIDIRNGQKELIREALAMGGELSPSGQFYTYFNEEQSQHYLLNLSDNSGTCMTCTRTDVTWETDNNGMPFEPYPYGVYGYDRTETIVYIQSEYDVWAFDIASRELTSVTDEMGANTKKRMRIRSWEYDSVYVDAENNYFTGFDEQTKDHAHYKWIVRGNSNFTRLLYKTPHRLNSMERSEDGEFVLLRQSNLREYADVYFTDKNFRTVKKLSNANPQIDEYNWATVELIDYMSYDSLELQGLLYKPENYDPKKSYPLLVYFYELYTDRLHNHYSPRPTASIIYPTEYASAGYMVLIPDIRYEPGYPAQSAYNCIMAATDEVLRQYPNVDSTRMGLQGQSWGGYQTAQLITMTNRYRAAMAGAPVANMFSAYGGIRWGSGLNRQFQYEKTQSRIGKTIWEAPELYVENSPLFHLPKVQTPLLIMHNDGDGAVPWYQGIELFTGMKRLGKPCWMLNYNGDAHNLRVEANKMDLSIRMRQFFDHYLMDASAPEWLVNGIPAIDKGKKYGLELITD